MDRAHRQGRGPVLQSGELAGRGRASLDRRAQQTAAAALEGRGADRVERDQERGLGRGLTHLARLGPTAGVEQLFHRAGVLQMNPLHLRMIAVEQDAVRHQARARRAVPLGERAQSRRAAVRAAAAHGSRRPAMKAFISASGIASAA